MFHDEFFPTPRSVSIKMLQKISKEARYFLEPSAGKGDIADAIRDKTKYEKFKVDCIEQSPELCAVLADKDFSVVGYDWLEYNGVCYYDAIVMNPPFSNGDEHLLKAWDFLHDGEIVCLLNEETIKNPCTSGRKRLQSIIEKHGNVEYLGDCFSTAQRKTAVRVAMVYLRKESQDDTIDLWAAQTQEKTPDDETDIFGAESNMLAIRDNLGNMQHYYDQANVHMFRAFQHIRKASLYMNANGLCAKYDGDFEKVLALAAQNINTAKAEFIRKHRNRAWHNVFSKMEFHKWLDKKQKDEFIRDIDRNGNIPFTKENIKGTLRNVFEQRQKLFERSVANVFDELTRYYKGNTNHTEGWKTNDSYKVNKKIVFPYGCVFEDKYGRTFRHQYSGSQIDIYNDLDRVLCVLNGRDFETCETIHQALDKKFRILGHYVKSPFDNETESRFFHIKFFMKGTVHLTFKDAKDWEMFNKAAAKGKAWLGQQTQKEAA
jgi:hypothetical protein